MAEEKQAACVEASTGLITPEADVESAAEPAKSKKEVMKMLAEVGKEAPDFELTAYHEGGFKNVRLSEYRGKWVLLCFYPGDFTFV